MLSYLTLKTLFIACAGLGGVLFLVRGVLGLLGAGEGSDGMDFADGDAALDGSGHSFQVLSVQGIAGFFLMFGLIGLVLSEQVGLGPLISTGGGLAAGVAMALIIARIMLSMKRLQSSGNVQLSAAVGAEGTVYLTVPADSAQTGQVQLEVQGRLRVYDANTSGGTALPEGARVRVTGVFGQRSLTVEKA